MDKIDKKEYIEKIRNEFEKESGWIESSLIGCDGNCTNESTNHCECQFYCSNCNTSDDEIDVCDCWKDDSVFYCNGEKHICQECYNRLSVAWTHLELYKQHKQTENLKTMMEDEIKTAEKLLKCEINARPRMRLQRKIFAYRKLKEVLNG